MVQELRGISCCHIAVTKELHFNDLAIEIAVAGPEICLSKLEVWHIWDLRGWLFALTWIRMRGNGDNLGGL